MIYDFAIEPELVATWHDRRVAYPFLSQLGPGHCRVVCAYPSALWQKLVLSAFQMERPSDGSPEDQKARKSIEVLLRHLQETGTRRGGRLEHGITWLNAAKAEHNQFPFGGIVVRSANSTEPFLVAADRLGEVDFPAWTPSAPPVTRQPRELANALAPILRSAARLCFIDPYFDVDVAAFFEPMREFLQVAQRRRSVGDLQIQIHFAVRSDELQQESRLQGRALRLSDLANNKLVACERKLKAFLHSGVTVNAFAWGRRMHNRYVLSEIGGIAVQAGLDRSGPGPQQTDDLTILSKEQHAARWAEYCSEGITDRPIAKCSFQGIAQSNTT